MIKADQKISQNLLNSLLANHAVVLVQTLNYHWNLEGAEFHDYHLLFDKQYNAVFADMDSISERVRAVEGIALGSMKEMLAAATLKEDSGKVPKPSIMVVNLLKQYEATIEQIREGLILLNKKTTDFGTINFLEDLLCRTEKTAWMLRALSSK